MMMMTMTMMTARTTAAAMMGEGSTSTIDSNTCGSSSSSSSSNEEAEEVGARCSASCTLSEDEMPLPPRSSIEQFLRDMLVLRTPLNRQQQQQQQQEEEEEDIEDYSDDSSESESSGAETEPQSPAQQRQPESEQRTATRTSLQMPSAMGMGPIVLEQDNARIAPHRRRLLWLDQLPLGRAAGSGNYLSDDASISPRRVRDQGNADHCNSFNFDNSFSGSLLGLDDCDEDYNFPVPRPTIGSGGPPLAPMTPSDLPLSKPQRQSSDRKLSLIDDDSDDDSENDALIEIDCDEIAAVTGVVVGQSRQAQLGGGGPCPPPPMMMPNNPMMNMNMNMMNMNMSPTKASTRKTNSYLTSRTASTASTAMSASTLGSVGSCSTTSSSSSSSSSAKRKKNRWQEESAALLNPPPPPPSCSSLSSCSAAAGGSYMQVPQPGFSKCSSLSSVSCASSSLMSREMSLKAQLQQLSHTCDSLRQAMHVAATQSHHQGAVSSASGGPPRTSPLDDPPLTPGSPRHLPLVLPVRKRSYGEEGEEGKGDEEDGTAKGGDVEGGASASESHGDKLARILGQLEVDLDSSGSSEDGDDEEEEDAGSDESCTGYDEDSDDDSDIHLLYDDYEEDDTETCYDDESSYGHVDSDSEDDDDDEESLVLETKLIM